MSSMAARLAALGEDERKAVLAGLTDRQAAELLWDWQFWARPNQLPPDGDWLTWLVLAGRGYGKTRTGSEWVRSIACGSTPLSAGSHRRIALVAETAADARDVLVEGDSGILSVHPKDYRPLYEPSKRRLTWPNGAVATLYNAVEPDQLRGPQHDAALCDEMCLVAGTVVATARGGVPIEAIRVGDLVWTRKGLRKVSAAWQSSPSAEVWELTTLSGRRLVGTGTHPVWIDGAGFVPLRQLQSGDMLAAWDHSAPSGAERRGISTAIITETGRESCCIERCIRPSTARCREILTCIISMATRPTIASTTLSRLAGLITCANTRLGVLSRGVLSGDAKTPLRGFGGLGRRKRNCASSVAKHLKVSGCEPNFASRHAKQRTSDREIPDTHPDSVASVIRLSDRAAVYNIEVDGEHEYFANGILTHNCKWRYARETWDQLQFGLRLGRQPRQVVTTTPRPIPVLREIMAADTTVVTRGSTLENAANLAPSFLTQVVKRYEGTRLGRQELDAEILDDLPGALWNRDAIDAARVREAPDLRRVVVAVDPSGTKGQSDDGDEIGIVVAGIGVDGRGYMLADRSCKLSPDGWGRRAVEAYHEFRADRIIAERNFGGAMVEHVIRTIDPTVSYKEVTASRGKVARAEPVAALYEQGRISHVGALPALEDQMCQIDSSGYTGEGSPDRADALVWALTELMLGDSGYDWSAFA